MSTSNASNSTWHGRLAHALALTTALLLTLSAKAQPKYNLITIVTDDQAQWAVGAYGNKECVTPNMDRLAREGMKFSNAFVTTPVCSPSRASFFTGLYGTQLNITDWINGPESAAGVGIPQSCTTWPEVLKQNGYTTALVGKWHLGGLPEYHPTMHGFDHFYGFLGGGSSPMNPLLDFDGNRVEVKGPVSDLFATNAIEFIEKNKDKPFSVCLMFREPHQPYQPMPEEDNKPFEKLDPSVPDARHIDPHWVKERKRAYYGAVHAADRNIGRVLDALDRLKLAENTIVLFTSDHGYNIGQHNIYTKGNGAWVGGGVHGPKRPNMFEESIRVPLIVRWPGVTKPGSSCERTVTLLDTWPTVLSMLNVKSEAKQHGRDFTPLLRGDSPPDWSDDFFGQYDLHNSGLAFMRMIRTPKWKLVRHHFSNGLDELYDLTNDSGEKNNLYNEKSARLTRDELQKRLTTWQESIDDPILKMPRHTPR